VAIVSGYEINKEQRRELELHNGHELDLVWEPDDHFTVGCQTCHEIIIEFYPET
jgi:hypothetical protein